MSGFKNIKQIYIILDFSNQVYRNFHATINEKLTNSDGINTGCIIGLSKVMMHAINKAHKEDSHPNLIICEDRKPTRKRKLYEKYYKDLLNYKEDRIWDGINEKQRIRYKGNRVKDDLDYDPIQICNQFISCIPCMKIWSEGEEADDVIASFVEKNKTKNMVIYSTDKDLWQLLDLYDNIDIILSDGSSPDKELCQKHFQSNSFSKIPLHKILRGDSGDNVKSILRFPFKKNIDVYENSINIEEYITGILNKHGKDSKEFNHLKKFKNIIKLNKELVKLKTDLDIKYEIIKNPDINKWRKLCMIFETPSLINSPLLKIY